jgi:hypothetical protein
MNTMIFWKGMDLKGLPINLTKARIPLIPIYRQLHLDKRSVTSRRQLKIREEKKHS